MSSYISRRMRTYTFTGPDDRFRCPDRVAPHQTIYGAKMFPPCGPPLSGELFRAAQISVGLPGKKLHTGGAWTYNLQMTSWVLYHRTTFTTSNVFKYTIYFEHLYCWPSCCCHGILAVNGYPAYTDAHAFIGIHALPFVHAGVGTNVCRWFFFLLLAVLLLASMLLTLSMLLLAPMLFHDLPAFPIDVDLLFSCHAVEVFRSLEGGFHFTMPEKSSGPCSETFYIPLCWKSLVPWARPAVKS